MLTIRDVAEAAEVSVATVSRYFNYPDKVKPSTADRIRKVVDELGYWPNLVARGLRRRSTRLLGLVVQDVEHPHFTGICRGAEDYARELGYSAVLCDTDDDLKRQDEYLRLLADQSVAGVILTPTLAQNTDVSVLQKEGIPVVSLEMRLGDFDSVRSDNVRGARAAVEHLIEQGARRIACITGPRDVPSAAERLDGYREALQAAGLEAAADLFAYTNYRESEAELATERFFNLPEPPDALFLANSRLAFGALRCLRRMGVHVPADVLLVGFDDLPWMELTDPSISAVRQAVHEIGYTAARMLIERVNGYDGPPRNVMMVPTLVQRESSTRPTKNPGA